MAVSKGLKIILLLAFFESYLVPVKLELIDPSLTTIVFYYGPTFEDSQAYPLAKAEDVVNHPKFIHDKTTLFVPDYYEPQLSDSHKNVDAYNKLNKINFLMVNWGAPMVKDKSEAKQPDTAKLEPLITDWILKLWKHIERQSFNVLAYAKGAELSGHVAKKIKEKTNGQKRIARISVCDPPKPDKEDGTPGVAIEQDDADFIDCIHTDANNYSSYMPVGHVNFWPNNGTSPQPGCKRGEDSCSHTRSWALWAESVGDQNGPQFCAYKASNYDEFLEKDVKDLGEPVLMGINCDKNARGNYYLKTNDKYPYARGLGK